MQKNVRKKMERDYKLLAKVSMIFAAGFILSIIGIMLICLFSTDQSLDAVTLLIFAIAIGGVLTLFISVMIGMFRSNFKNFKNTEHLIETGARYTGMITDVIVDDEIIINGQSAYRACCQVEEPYTNKIYTYYSDATAEDITGYIGRQVNVYVDRKNMRKGYVALFQPSDEQDTDRH